MTPCANQDCKYAAAPGNPYCCAVCQNANVIGKYGYAWHSELSCSRIRLSKPIPPRDNVWRGRDPFRRRLLVRLILPGMMVLMILFCIGIVWGWK